MKYEILDYADLCNKDVKHTPRVFLNYLGKKEVGLLVGDSNCGKTFLAHDLLIAANSGVTFWDKPVSDGPVPKCVFLDLEQSTEQSISRMQGVPESLVSGIVRIGLAKEESDTDIPLDEMLRMVTKIIRQQDESLVVIDNLTSLIGRHVSESAAVRFIKRLKKMANDYNCSFLIIAHTRKRRVGTPFTIDDITGAKTLVDSVDSVMALAESVKGDGTAYLKHLKSKVFRKYREVAELELVEEPYTHFRLVDWNSEAEHLPTRRVRAKKHSDIDIQKVIRLHVEDGLSLREIERKTGVPRSTVKRIIEEFYYEQQQH